MLTSPSTPSDGTGSRSTPEALARLWEDAHEDLHRMAHQRMRAEQRGTLRTTVLVNEVYLRLVAQRKVQWADRAQFFALAAQAMRRILIDYARRHRRLRGRVPYDSIEADAGDSREDRRAVRLAATQRADQLLALDDALDRLARVDERVARVVECRFFAGYSEEETAAILGVTARTVTRDWAKAKAWLHRELEDAPAVNEVRMDYLT